MAATHWHKQAPAEPLKLAISYGLFGGPLSSHHFRRLAVKAGFIMSPLDQADIIVAHSAGCWLLPVNLKPRLVVYAGLPLTDLSPRQAWLQMNANSFGHRAVWRSLYTTLLTAWYSLLEPRRNLDIIRHPQINRPIIYADAPAVLIVNRHDPWPQTSAMPAFIEQHDWAFLSLPGTHDDIWEHPKRFVEVIKHYAALLA